MHIVGHGQLGIFLKQTINASLKHFCSLFSPVPGFGDGRSGRQEHLSGPRAPLIAHGFTTITAATPHRSSPRSCVRIRPLVQKQIVSLERGGPKERRGKREQQKKTYYPSGMYRRTMSGIFFSLSSLMAIWRGSVSPSRSTRTGAFMLICRARVPRMRAFSYLVM